MVFFEALNKMFKLREDLFSHVLLLILASPLTLVMFPQDRTLKRELWGDSLPTPNLHLPSLEPHRSVRLKFACNDVLVNQMGTREL